MESTVLRFSRQSATLLLALALAGLSNLAFRQTPNRRELAGPSTILTRDSDIFEDITKDLEAKIGPKVKRIIAGSERPSLDQEVTVSTPTGGRAGLSTAAVPR